MEGVSPLTIALTGAILLFIVACIVAYYEPKKWRIVMSDLTKLQEEVGQWSRQNFPNNEPYYALLGAVEEVGELAHAHLKSLQNIRGMTTEMSREKKMDAVGDIIIYLADYCERNNLDLETCVFGTWEVVMKRNWQKSPQDGK